MNLDLSGYFCEKLDVSAIFGALRVGVTVFFSAGFNMLFPPLNSVALASNLNVSVLAI